ncbi:hypothetical protein PINS_up019785 [Pythium insidiosum]|nr:hypothetical protein PINS_up019785 [Pythium insidiosum]
MAFLHSSHKRTASFASFFIPSAVFVVAFFVFYCGKDRYRRVPPKGSALSTFFAVLFEAGRHSRRGKLVLSGGFAFIPGIVLTTVSYFVTDPVWHMIFACLDLARCFTAHLC